MPDATMFSLDVVLSKARNAYYFSSREGYEVLQQLRRRNPTTTTLGTATPDGRAGR